LEPLKAVTCSDTLGLVAGGTGILVTNLRTDMFLSYGGEDFSSVKSATAVKVKL
jgi:hypothetical protein